MEERLGLHLERLIRPQDARQQLQAGLDRPLGPAMLLRLERVHLDRHFRRRDDVRQELEPPATQLRAVAEVEVLGQRVVLPSARRSIASRRQIPAVPLKLKKQPARLRPPCSSTKCASSRIDWIFVSSE